MCRNSFGPCAFECGPERAGDHELRLRELLAQHAHERNRCRLRRNRRGGFPKVALATRRPRTSPARATRLGAFQPLLAPRTEARPPRHRARRCGQQLSRAAHPRLRRPKSGGRRRLKVAVVKGSMHVAGILRLRQPAHAGDRELRPPGAVQDQLDGIIGHRLGRRRRRDRWSSPSSPSTRATSRAWAMRSGRDLRIELFRHHGAGRLVLDARDQLAHDPEARRHDAGGGTRMHALLQHPHGDRAAPQAAQRGGEPELAVIAATGIQADDQRRRAELRCYVVDVMRQIRAAGFSQASIRITARACGMPCSRKAMIDVTAEKIA